jgi:branched-chain amino acid transport system substrate-binding protein
MPDSVGFDRREFLRWTGKATVGAALIGGFPALLDACSSSPASSKAPSGSTTKTVTVGGIFSLTGATALYGESARDGLQVVFDQVNKAGGIKSLGGAQIKMNVYDDAGSPTTASSQVSRAISDGAVAAIGCGDGGAALGASQTAGLAGFPFLTADPTDTITTRGFNSVFQVTPLGGAYFHEGVTAMVKFAKDAGQPLKRVAIVQGQIATWAGLAPQMAPYLQTQGLEVVANQSYPTTETNFGSIASTIKSSNPDLVIVFSVSEADAAGVVRALSVVNATPKAVLGVIAGFITGNFATDLGSLSEGLFGVAQFTGTVPFAKVKDEVSRWNALIGPSLPINAFGALYITTGGVLVDALESAASTDKAKVIRALRATNLSIGDNYVVLPGGVKFNSNGANVSGSGVVFQYKSGNQVPVYPAQVATAKPVFPKIPWG